MCHIPRPSHFDLITRVIIWNTDDEAPLLRVIWSFLGQFLGDSRKQDTMARKDVKEPQDEARRK
jgi:hypothetical protein